MIGKQINVAVKIFTSTEANKFSRELDNMKKVAAVNPPFIVKCLGHCVLKDRKLGLVLEVFDTDLMQFLTSPCSLPEAKPILKQIALGLKHLLNLGIVHRDIKPDNILVRKVNNGWIQVALTDLGVSKHMTKTQRSNQSNIGTDLWMAPEVKG